MEADKLLRLAKPTITAFSNMVDAAAEEYAFRESIIPKKRVKAKAAFVEALKQQGILSNVSRWVEVETYLQSCTAQNARVFFVMFWTCVVIDVCIHIFLPSMWAKDAKLFLVQQLSLFSMFASPRLARAFTLTVWRQIWRTSVLNPSREEVVESCKRVGAPKSAHYLLWLVTPKENRRDSIEEINESFEVIKAEFGLARAHVFYWGEVFKTLWVSWGGEALKELAKWFLRDLFMK